MKKNDLVKIVNLSKGYEYLADYKFRYIKKYQRGIMTFAILRFEPGGSRFDVNIKNVVKI